MFISQSDGPFQKSLRIPLEWAEAGPWKEVSQGHTAGEALVPGGDLGGPHALWSLGAGSRCLRRGTGPFPLKGIPFYHKLEAVTRL